MSVPTAPRVSLVLGALGLALGCGAKPPAAPVKPVAPATGPWKPSYPQSRTFPDLSPQEWANMPAPTRASEAGADNRIVGRMRVRVREGGVMERADDLLPIGRASAIELPSRLGGGYVFTVITSHGSQIYRAEEWLSRLQPLLQVTSTADAEGPIVVGFDRLYLRLKSNNDLIAFDPKTGKAMPLGSLPVAPSYGDMVFVDGWRAVVESEVTGVMATFDAGATWKVVPIDAPISGITAIGGDPSIMVEGGEYRLDARGQLNFSRAQEPAPSVKESTLNAKSKVSPLGRRPLRAALEDGYPDENRTGVVLRGGALARVSLDDGSVVEMEEHAVPETLSCHAIKLGPKFGFVCGEPSGGTSLYEFHSPLSVAEVASFDEPRVVVESGQGLVVISGSCGRIDEPAPSTDGKKPPKSFCVRALDGTLREIRVRGNVGAERVVALSDGRVAVLVPPRPGSLGQISLIDKATAKHVTIKISEDAPLQQLETGMWLDGFQESAPDEIAGWVEAGGPILGVRIKLDGTLTPGQLAEEERGVMVSGPYGLAVGAQGRALETVDGGMTWQDIVLPVLPSRGNVERSDDRVRRCGTIGCALPGILRVGWAEPHVTGDLDEAPDPDVLRVAMNRLVHAPLEVACGGPTSPKKRPGTKRPSLAYGQAPGGWNDFLDTDAPVLATDEVGLDNGAPFDQTPMRAYVWGKKDSDWARTGRLEFRFGDRFSLDPVRASAVTRSFWNDQDAAGIAFGVGGQYAYSVSWSASPDPSGAAAIAWACRSNACQLYGVDDGRAVLPFRAGRGANGLVPPLWGSTVRVGESWFYLGDGVRPDHLALYRVDLGTTRLVKELPRPHAPRYVSQQPLRLVRRASGSGIGITFTMRRSYDDRRGERFVVPLDAETGEVGEAIDLGQNDLGSLGLRACDEARDGWVMELSANDPIALVDVLGESYFMDSVDARVRLDPGYGCVEALTAQTDRDPPSGAKAPSGAPKKVDSPPLDTFPLVVSQQGSGQRLGFSCSVTKE
ncbi:MAG: hypothetical protein U0414_27925 [Polyangiaceae bacterium]